MDNNIKFIKAIKSLKSGVEFSYQGDITTKAEFDKVRWKTGVDSEGTTIDTTTNPHSELTWTKVNNAMTTLQTAYDGVGAVQRKRATEYAPLKEQLDLLYKDMTAGKLDASGEWHKSIKKVKDDNPKG
jgi:hypothetical protein